MLDILNKNVIKDLLENAEITYDVIISGNINFENDINLKYWEGQINAYNNILDILNGERENLIEESKRI